ncbi:MAG TPA: FHA domain-containing protein [Candidatus Limnocylindria bacterium]|nr:FHA domain-containing protein [Candidatus Limnocylindria bacterium]
MVRYILRGLTHPLEHELHSGLNTVGRNPTNEFRISDASVSSFHAEITVVEGGTSVTVRDLQSTNGTFIDSSPVEEAVIRAGQTLQIGAVELRLEAEQFEIKVPVAAAPQVAQPAGFVQALPDGTLACSRNPSLPATHHATHGCGAVVKCPGVFNIASLRAMKLSGGTAGLLLFCPDCNAKCEPLPGVSDSAATKKKGLFARLTQTIQIGWKK